MTSDVYPRPEDEARYPFEPYAWTRLPAEEQLARGRAFFDRMAARRSVRTFSTDPVPRDLVELAVATAATAPSGAHQQPWTFAVTGDPDVKHRIRLAAEAEERQNYEGGRMGEAWIAELARLGTHPSKGYLDDAPWLVVAFAQRYGVAPDGSHVKHYYVTESVGIACGLFIAALHEMGLATVPHTPSPMGFLRDIFGRPANEKPMVLFPVGYPAAGSKVPSLDRKPLSAVLVDPRSSGSA